MNKPDTALLSFLNSVSKTESETALADLLAKKIQPVIEKTLRAKLRVSLKPNDFSQNNQEALELAGEAKLLLIAELERLKANPNGKVISNLDGYVASVAVNIYRQYLRSKYPLREQLKNKLRYLLSHHPKFALWEDEHGWLCGFKQNKRTQNSPDAETIQAGIAETVSQKKLGVSSKLINLLTAVFEYTKAPIPFNELLSVVARIHQIKDRNEISDIEEPALSGKLFTAENGTLTEIEQQEYLKKIWAEICTLPVRHRLALLLNLRNKQGDCLITLFPLLRIASIREIAEILEFSPEQFAVVWRELPWEDLKIAEYLGITRQQVINLRQSARARLARTMKQ